MRKYGQTYRITIACDDRNNVKGSSAIDIDNATVLRHIRFVWLYFMYFVCDDVIMQYRIRLVLYSSLILDFLIYVLNIRIADD